MKKLTFIMIFILSLVNIFSEIEIYKGDVKTLGIRYFYFDLEDESRSMVRAANPDEDITSNAYRKTYNVKIDNFYSWLNSNTCSLSKENNLIKANYKLDGANGNYINHLKELGNQKITTITGNQVKASEILNTNLWMRVDIKARPTGGSIKKYENVLITDDGLNMKHFLKSKKYQGRISYNIEIKETKCPNFDGPDFIPYLVEGGNTWHTTQLPISNLDFVEVVENNNFEKAEKVKDENVFKVGSNSRDIIYNEKDENIKEDLEDTPEILIINSTGNKETIPKSEVALALHKITKFNSEEEAIKDLKRVITKTSQSNLNESVNYNSITNKTTFKIKGNFKKGDKVYIFVPKIQARSISKISGNFFVVEEDPIIGYHFSNEGVEYSIDGNLTRGGLILVDNKTTYQSNNLFTTIKKEDCDISNKEVLLYSLNNLSGSDHSQFSTGDSQTYRVCLSHKNKSIDLTKGEARNIIGLNRDIATLKINESLFYEVRKVSKRPSNEYVCVGSYDKYVNTQKVADCNSYENRIWLYVGTKDILKLNTIIERVREDTFKFKVFNGGENVKINYTIDNNLSQITNSNQDIKLTCIENDCERKISFFSFQQGKENETKKEDTFLVGRSINGCSSSCYGGGGALSKACNNYNGCKFYQYNKEDVFDSGKEASIICDGAQKGHIFHYTNGRDLICPKQIRNSLYTNEKLKIKVEENQNIHVKRYLVKPRAWKGIRLRPGNATNPVSSEKRFGQIFWKPFSKKFPQRKISNKIKRLRKRPVTFKVGRRVRPPPRSSVPSVRGKTRPAI